MADTIATHTLHISAIHVDFNNSRKNIQSAVARIGKSQVPIESRAGKTLRQTFVPPLKLSLQDSFSLRLSYKKMFKRTYNIQFDNEDIFRTVVAHRLRDTEYRMSHKEISIILELSGNSSTDETSDSDLPSTTEEIFQICPRFRILVMGKTGVGKSSLIEQAFGVRSGLTSDLIRGEANIDTEFDSQQNKRFVLHDSKGFEAGDTGNVNIVREFIERRKNMSLKDQLHAIWLCFEIPYANGRFLETGTKEFLDLKRDGKLGDVPIVVVFTKYDMLINQANLELGLSLNGLSDDASQIRIKEKAETKLREICIEPLEKFAGSDIPRASVSTHGDYKETLVDLIKVTEDQVYKHVAADASVMAIIAQRVDHSLKIKASIEVGKRKYWTALASSVAFKDRKLWACMHVLHTDIVAVWNFDDPHGYLRSDEFRNLMMNMVYQLNVGPPTNPTKIVAAGLPMVAAIAGILSALSGPATPIVVPIAAGAVLAAWVYEVYQSSHAVLQRFMSFIVDLTMVLQLLHLASGNQELSRRAIKLAVKLYLDLPMSGEVHTKVQEYVGQLTILSRADCDTLNKIIELINSYTIDAGNSGLREQILKVPEGPDEMW